MRYEIKKNYVIVLLIILLVVIILQNENNEIFAGTEKKDKYVTINIEKKEEFKSIGNQYVTPGSGKRYVAYLVTIRNTSSKQIYGGSYDSHDTFEISTTEGYVIQAENTSSQAWKNNRIVWNANDIPPNEIRKGWIVFSVPNDDMPKTFVFHVSEIVGPHFLNKLGKVTIELK